MISVPGYQTLGELHDGEHTHVCRALRKADNLPVILKMLKGNNPALTQLARVRHEYALLSELDIDGVVKVLSLEEMQHTLAIVFKDSGGQALNTTFSERPMPMDTFFPIAIKLAHILGEIHSANIIHKDINPANIVRNPETGQIEVIDFDIATYLPYEAQDMQPPVLLEGSLPYISPEQTGRMNRRIDYRSDFYSLGITYYELLAKAPPFRSSDPLQLLHHHLARTPVALSEENPAVPQPLSRIVMKLIAKDPETRYQSAWGIKSDLDKCWKEYQSSGGITDFFPSSQDVSEKFHIHQKLYGRENETGTLLEMFERVCQGTGELLLVSGRSGIGKTSLVREVYRPLTLKRGLFISGKYQRFQHDVPYSALVEAFRMLARQLLAESDERLIMWRDKIGRILGTGAQVITDVIPEMALIIGESPPAPRLGPLEAQNRFNMLFQKFIKLFCREDHPLVIFLDDLQWADAASYKLLERIMTDKERHHLFLIGAYRSEEIGDGHPLVHWVKNLQQQNVDIHDLPLSPLAPSHVTALLSETLHCSPERAAPLAELVSRRTDGNPFFIEQLLKSIHAAGLIRFDYRKMAWEWQMMHIERHGPSGDLVDLMADKIRLLNPRARQVLQVCACIGGRFQFETVMLAGSATHAELIDALKTLCREGLLLPLGDAIKLLDVPGNGIPAARPIEFRFAHDRIQQAAYAFVHQTDRLRIHQRVGEHLLKKTPADQLKNAIFDIANHLNTGISGVTGPQERKKLSELNLIAGRQAKTSTAFASSYHYLRTGIELLDEDAWQTNYAFTLSLYTEAAESAYLCSEYRAMDAYLTRIFEMARTTIDKIGAYEIKIEACKAQYLFAETFHNASACLKLLGIHLKKKPGKRDVALSLIHTRLLLSGKQIDALAQLPEARDPLRLAAIRIMTRLSSTAYFADPNLFILLVCQQVAHSVRYGNAPESAFFYALYGLIQCGVLGRIATGYAFGQLALAVTGQRGADEFKARTYNMVNGFIVHWKSHVYRTIKPLSEAFQIGLETGDLEYAGHAAFFCSYHTFVAGCELSRVEREMAVNGKAILRLKHEASRHMHNIYRQTVSNLKGETDQPMRLAGAYYDEAEGHPLHDSANDRTTLYNLYFNKLYLAYMFGGYRQALDHAHRAKKYIDGIVGTFAVPLFYFFDSLNRLALWPEAALHEKRRFSTILARNQKKMKKWALHAPMNHRHRYRLVEAEWLRVKDNRSRKAARYYEEAIQLALKHKYLNDEALANELAARHYMDAGLTTVARAYIQKARYCYEKWGAMAKVKAIDGHYGDLLSGLSPISKPVVYRVDTSGKGTQHMVAGLDVVSFIKASQAISGEIVLDRLLKQMMHIIMESAGAQNGCLILKSGDSLLIEAEAIAGKEIRVRQAMPVEKNENLCHAMVNYVARTHDHIMLGNASEQGDFTHDADVNARRLQSVLCAPIIHKSALVGILYLENNLTAGAFTVSRLEMLKLLSTQIAISLENAGLYKSLAEQTEAVRTLNEQLEQRVVDRTAELRESLQALKQTQAKLVQSEKMASLGELVSGIAHEINTPLGVINSNSDMIRRYIQKSDTLQAARPGVQQLIAKIKRKIEVTGDACGVIMSIINSLRVFARLDEAAYQSVSLHTLVDNTLSMMRNKLKDRIHIDKKYEYTDPVRCFPSQLNQVIMNITNNAYDAMDGQGNLTISITSLGKYVKLSFSDTGTGIPDDVMPKIFDPGYTTKGVGVGTGLGLSICYRIIVETHGGRIWAENREDNGTRIQFVIPREGRKEGG